MKTFNKCAAQGDVLFIRREAMPEGLTEQAADPTGALIVTHSETGHNHVMVLDRPAADAVPAVQMFNDGDPLKSWLQVNRPTSLDHLREHHTHESIMFEAGVYEVRRQVESTPEGWKRVQD